MSLWDLLSKLSGTHRAPLRRRGQQNWSQRRPLHEALEDRRLLAVTSFPGNDSQPNLNLTAIVPQTVVAGQTLTINLATLGGTLTDVTTGGAPTGDLLRWLADPDTGVDFPTGATLSVSGVFTWTPTAAQIGQHTVTVIGIDAGTPALADAETFSITVTAATVAAPVVDLNGADAGSDATATFAEDGGLVAITSGGLTITDSDSTNLTGATATLTARPDGTAESLAVTTTGTPITFAYDSATGVLSLTGTATVAQYQQVLRTLVYGNTSQNPNTTARVVQLTTTDGTNISAVRTSTISITAVNDAPNLTASTNVTVVIGNQVIVNVTATDPENNTLTFALDPDNSPADATITQTGNTATIRWTPTVATYPNSVPFRVVVTDSGVAPLSDSETFTVTVHEVNLAPNLAPIADQEGTVGEELEIEVVASNANTGQTLVFTLDPESPAGATITPTGATTAVIRWTPTAGDVRTNTFRVIVTDDGFLPLTDAESFDVTVVLAPVNQPPTITPIDHVNGIVGTQVVVAVTAIDPDGDTLVFSLVTTGGASPLDATIEQTSNTTATIRWTPTLATEGTSVAFRVQVLDNGSPALSETWNFHVEVADVTV